MSYEVVGLVASYAWDQGHGNKRIARVLPVYRKGTVLFGPGMCVCMCVCVILENVVM